jgi:predicted dehydrogenase
MVDETDGDAFSTSETRPTFKDPYTVEIEAFHDAVTRGVPPKTTPEDARRDLVLFRWIVDAIRRSK